MRPLGSCPTFESCPRLLARPECLLLLLLFKNGCWQGLIVYYYCCCYHHLYNVVGRPDGREVQSSGSCGTSIDGWRKLIIVRKIRVMIIVMIFLTIMTLLDPVGSTVRHEMMKLCTGSV